MSDAEPPILPMDVAGTRLTLLPDGPGRLAALIALIEGARESLRVLYYIWADDETGRQVRDALVAAAARGVSVSLLVDGFGSSHAKEGFFRPLVEAKARFCRFVPRWGRRYLLRNHQKLALADGRRAIVGGFNISNDYFGTIADGAWRDLGLEVDGPNVEFLVRYYDALFTWAEMPDASIRRLRRTLFQSSVREGPFQWLFGGPTRRLSPWARSVKNDLMRAKRVDIISAYFAPSLSMMRRLFGVAARGAVRIVTPAKLDHQWAVGAARFFYWRLLKRGVEIYEYQPTKLHAKLIVIDDVVHIGSANFDLRSLYLNLEMMLRVDDPGFAAMMRRFVDGEIANSKRITPEAHRAGMTWWNRLKWAFGYFLVATADYNLARRLNFRPTTFGRRKGSASPTSPA
jgi:cardiolipin synthase